ncbi:phosphoribosylanthranilate isomerase [Mangrovimonas yunxiaonensis]|nr:phosphoribosylanthranilate isomerase [Mangrovimonas yunxiaonensis]GGH40099.1 N-(5'-phosphoribosyl)anthranilate isomerase [Mangrovimonas yunxiaonensis]
MMNLKICGMKYNDNLLEAAALRPNYLGFIFYEKSQRYFNGTIPKLPKNIKKTGVFVNAHSNTIKTQITKHDLQAVQLHGQEPPELCAALKQSRVEVIKAFSIKDTFNFQQLEAYETFVDFFLFDTKGKLPGGNGTTFNWEVLKHYPATTPYFLSGGIGLNSIEALNGFLKHSSAKHCYGLDVNSQFEIEPGLKDIELLKTFKQNMPTGTGYEKR